jgi:hypothetical protein
MMLLLRTPPYYTILERQHPPLNVIASVSTARLALLNQEETKWSPGKIR